MMDLRTIDELTRKLGEQLPPGLSQAKEEAEARFRAVLTAAFERMNLVTREEFDAQCHVLARSRKKIDDLERRLDKLQAG